MVGTCLSGARPRPHRACRRNRRLPRLPAPVPGLEYPAGRRRLSREKTEARELPRTHPGDLGLRWFDFARPVESMMPLPGDGTTGFRRGRAPAAAGQPLRPAGESDPAGPGAGGTGRRAATRGQLGAGLPRLHDCGTDRGIAGSRGTGDRDAPGRGATHRGRTAHRPPARALWPRRRTRSPTGPCYCA